MPLNFIWKVRLRLFAEGVKLRAKGDKLRAEGNKLWAVAVLVSYGNIKMEWQYVAVKDSYRCVLENGEVYEP